MPSPKVERALTIASAIADHKSEITRLEAELENIVSPHSRREVENGRRVPKRRISRLRFQGRQRNRSKVLAALKKAGGPVKLIDLRKKLRLSESCVHTNIVALVKEKLVVRRGHGTYETT